MQGYSADKAGVQLLYFTPGLGGKLLSPFQYDVFMYSPNPGGVLICNFMCNRWPRHTFPCVFLGTIIEAIGVGLLAYALYIEDKGFIYGMMAVVGCGSGMRFMASPLHGIGLFKNLRASVIALMALAVPFGGTVGLTIMAAVFNNTSGLDSDSGFSQIRSQPEDVRAASIHGAKVITPHTNHCRTPY